MDRYTAQASFLQETDKLLRTKTVAIVGLGALGSVSAQLLARAGVGKLILIDHDLVELGNLQRQLLFDESDINQLKADAAAKKLRQINSEIDIVAKPLHLDSNTIEAIAKADLVLDCTDNFQTRQAINQYSNKHNTPWIFCSAVGAKGQVLVIDQPGIFDAVFGNKQGLTCEGEGILATASATAASIQCTQAIKLLTNQTPNHNFISIDLWNNKLTEITITPITPKKIPSQTDLTYSIDKCKTRRYIKAHLSKTVQLDLDKIKNNYLVEVDTPILCVIEIDNKKILVHGYGELVFYDHHNKDEVESLAKQIWACGNIDIA